MTRFRAQDGSIPLSLLVVILVGGLAAALLSTVTATQQSVTFDRQYAEAITVADSNLQQALTYLQVEGDTFTTGATLRSGDVPGLDNDLGTGTGEWVARKLGPAQWEVRAEGTVGEVTRVVESSLAAEPEFFLAAFGELGITMNGANVADSYPLGGFGAVGSNNLMTLRGSTVVDLIYQYGGTAACSGTGCSTGTTNGFDEPYDMDGIRANVLAKHAVCTGFSAWTASTELSDGDGDGYYELMAPLDICASDVIIDVPIEVVGGSRTDPVQFLVTEGGEIAIDRQIEVNCAGCATGTLPVSGQLRFYTLGGLFQVGNNTQLGAAVLAPNATCQGNPSGAQADIYGSLVCAQVGRANAGNQGGWNFHFDEDLLRVGSGKLDIDSYREETATSSSFAWTTP